jgi:hypothetical protein
MLTSSWRNERATPLRDAVLFFRLRPLGAEWQISAALPTDNKNVLGPSFTVLQGFGDFLGVEELAQIGIVVPTVFARTYMHPDEVDECFSVASIRPEAAPVPTLAMVTKATGEKVAVSMAVPSGRRLRLPRT